MTRRVRKAALDVDAEHCLAQEPLAQDVCMGRDAAAVPRGQHVRGGVGALRPRQGSGSRDAGQYILQLRGQ